MNKISDEQIFEVINNQLKYIYSKYDEKQVLGIFTYGKVNYGFAQSIEDIQTLFVYLPSYSELCSLEPDFQTKTYIQNEKFIIKKIDIRGVYNFASHQDGIMIEALCSEYQIINPRFKKVFKKFFLLNKEMIFHCDPVTRVENIIATAEASLNFYKQNKSVDDLFKACYLRIACRLYLDGVSCENCINLKRDYHISYLWQILKGEIIPNIDEIYEDLKLFKEEINEQKPNINKEIQNIITDGVQEILKISLTDVTQTEDFKKKLTDLELQALSVILDNLADKYEGIISVSQLVNSSGISRPVFKSVLDKMKTNLIAEWENKGVKGTYIKIIDGNLLSE